ncbi:kinase [Dokdonella sp.]|uniref:kinase n=1 Tax=Dokdonella sp. TaxID=2291710 RepID=UPI002F410D7E
MRADASTRGHAADVVERVLDASLARGSRARRPLLVGIAGVQGSGKSTLARDLAVAARRRGVRCEVLSLDDFYHGRRERLRLARVRHPLFETRGVPGTHDLALLRRTLAALANASARRPVRVPRFDKGRDTRVVPSRWRRVTQRPALILLEGWCVGVPAQAARDLRRSANALERDEDRERRWRGAVNRELARDYARLWRGLDHLVLLQAPSFAVVGRWRDQQERALRARGAPRALDRAALRRFLMHFERLSRHALRALPHAADIRIVLDRNRRVRAIAGA